jgi:iron complex outermembrane receptor protein
VDGEVFADLSGLSIEELMDVEVVSASRHEQSQAAAPSAVSVITADEIRLHGWRTLVEALATVPGLYTAYDRNYHYVGVRGILRPGDFGSRVLILTDGRRVNDPLYNQGPVGREFPLDLALVERIEIVHGPGSSLYGTNALLAVVNVVTKSAADARGVEFAAGAAGGHAAFGRVSWEPPDHGARSFSRAASARAPAERSTSRSTTTRQRTTATPPPIPRTARAPSPA